jgi:SpoVK/Ycf46/Vps4 family AAA+-type ATPase
MTQTPSVFDKRVALPDEGIGQTTLTLLGFEDRYQRVRRQLGLLMHLDRLEEWSWRLYGRPTRIIRFVSEQHPLVIFHGDVGTGKTVTAEGIAHRLAAEDQQDRDAPDSELFKLSTRVRGSGRVGEMGTLLTQAFEQVSRSAGQGRRAFLIIDEGDSLAAKRSQEHSHHEDKVAVNTLIQNIDELRRFNGRVLVFLCTNRLSVVDPALVRRAAIVESFERPSAAERLALFRADLGDLGLSEEELAALVEATGPADSKPGWTYSDLRARLYPAVMARAFPDGKLTVGHFLEAIATLEASPAMEDA